MILNIKNVINSPSALTREQGEIVYDIIKVKIANKEEVLLDFIDVESLLTPFLNVAIGKLYGDFSSEDLNKYLKLENFPKSKVSTMKIVISNAKKFYKDPKKFNEIIEGGLE